jgi:photosystem II stability/assembly factor-like uncharacterized protein
MKIKMKKNLCFKLSRIFSIVILVAGLLSPISWVLAEDFPAYWTSTGPYGGEVKDIVLSNNYVKDTTIFAASSGGVYKSTDGGKSFIQLLPHAPYGVSSLAISPDYSNDQTIFFGGSNDLLKSTDGGDNWNYTNSPIRSSSLTISPNYINDQTILIGSTWDEGIARSTDGGQSWTLINKGLTDLSVDSLAFSPDFANDHTVFAGTDYAIFKSTDSGDSWNLIFNFNRKTYTEALVVSPNYSVDQTVFVGLRSSLYKSTDAGEHWTKCGVGPVGSLAISHNFSNDQTLFAGTLQGEIFRSTNGGTDWELVNKGLPVDWIQSLCVSPNFANDQLIYAGLGVNSNGSGLFKSINGGDQWSQVAGWVAPRRISSLAISPHYAFDNTIFTGSGDEVFRSNSSDLSWSMVGSGIGGQIVLTPCYAIDQTVFAASYYDVFYKSTNGGGSWKKIPTDLLFSSVWDLAASPNYFFDRTLFVGGNWGVYKSQDRGETWVEVKDGLIDKAINEIEISPNYYNDHTIFAGGNNFGVFKSVNGGDSWEYVSSDLPQSTGYSGPSIEALEISPNYANDGTIFTSVRYEAIFRSTDEGASWSSVYPDYASAIALSPNYANDGTVLASIRYDNLAISQDYGNTWMQINTMVLSESISLSSISVSPHFSQDHTFFCGTDKGVFKVNILINLSSFEVIPKSNKIIVEWTTASEVENEGFNIYRSESEDGPYSQINDSLILSEGTPAKGANYELVDDNVKNRKKYYYKLKAISLNGVETEYGPVCATPRLIFGP